MKEIKVFLASSEEMKYDRLCFSDLIRRLDYIYEKRGIRIKLFQWEDFDSAYDDRRKQDEYNEYVRQSDIFIALFRTKAGEFTKEEFYVAKDEYGEKGFPKPNVYCRELYIDETEDYTLTEFKKQLLDELGYFFVKYTNEDALNLHFVMQLQLFENSQKNNVEVQGDNIAYEGLRIGSVDNIDFFIKNEDFIRMREDILELNEDIIDLRNRIECCAEDDRLKKRLQDKLDKRNSIQKKLDEQQMLILNIERRIIEYQGKETNEVISRAASAFANGKVVEAKLILDEVMVQAKQRRNNYVERKKIYKEILAYERGNIKKDIDVLLLNAELVLVDLTKDIEERKMLALESYQEADGTAQDIDLDKEDYIRLLDCYSCFMLKYAWYDKSAIEIMEKAKDMSEEVYGKEHHITAKIYTTIGSFNYNKGEYEKALRYYDAAFKIREKILSPTHPDIVTSCINMGFVLSNLCLEGLFSSEKFNYIINSDIYKIIAQNKDEIDKYFIALEYYYKALCIQLDNKRKDDINTSTLYNNIGIVYSHIGEYLNKCMSEDDCNAVIKKYLSLCCKYKEHIYRDTNICVNFGQIDETVINKPYYIAIEYLSKCISIDDKISKEEFGPLNNKGVIYHALGEYDKALECFNAAFNKCENVFGRYNPHTAAIYYNIAQVYCNVLDYQSALNNYSEAYEIYKEIFGREDNMTIDAKREMDLLKKKIKMSKSFSIDFPNIKIL